MRDYYKQTKIEENTKLLKIYDKYINHYLPNSRAASPNTRRSYKNTLNCYIKHLEAKYGKTRDKICFTDFSRENVTAYLDSLYAEGRTATTINQKRSCFCAFFSFASSVDPSLSMMEREIRKVPIKRQAQPPKEETLTPEEINLVIAQIDKTSSTRLKYRNKAIFYMLYVTAARISELLDIHLSDINMRRKKPEVLLHGKGCKMRPAPLNEPLVALLKDYAKANGIDLDGRSETPLFFVTHNGRKDPMCADTVRKMLYKYEKLTRSEHPSFCKHLHPHLMRATRATHMLSDNRSIYEISRFLGHAYVATTEGYLRIDPSTICEAIRKSACDANNPLHSVLDPTIVQISDKHTLAKYRNCA